MEENEYFGKGCLSGLVSVFGLILMFCSIVVAIVGVVLFFIMDFRIEALLASIGAVVLFFILSVCLPDSKDRRF